MTEIESEDFSNTLISHYDSSRETRWSPSVRQGLVKASGGNPKLLVDIVRVGSQMESLGSLQTWANEKSERFSEALSHYLAWVIDKIPKGSVARQVLELLSEISPLSVELLQELMAGRAVSKSLENLKEAGLIEQWGDDLYRISPLLQRRLKRQLAISRESFWFEDALRAFARSPRIVEASGHVYARIEAAIRAGMWSTGAAPDLVTKYVSAAHMFEMGIRLYDSKKYVSAFPLLYEAFKQRQRFDPSVIAEITRFYGLVSVRLHKDEHIENALIALRSSNAKDLADYLIGFRDELDGRFASAIASYKTALDAANDRKNVRRAELVLPRLIRSILRSPQPKWGWAIDLARSAVERSDSVFALRSLAHACLESVHKDEDASDYMRNRTWQEYLQIMERLKNDPTGGSLHASLKAREFELDDKFEEALEWAKTAEALGGIEQRFQVWHLTLLLEERPSLKRMADDVRSELSKPTSRARYELLAPTLSFGIRAFLKLDDRSQARHLLQRYSSDLSSTQSARLGRLISGSAESAEHEMEFLVS